MTGHGWVLSHGHAHVRTVAGDDAGAVQLELTEDGSALHQRIGEAIARNSTELFGGIDVDDLATTRKVLLQVTERARSLQKGRA